MGKRTIGILLLTITAAMAGFAGMLASEASAVRYTVAQCGWHVGADAGWADTSAGKFTRSSYCQAPASADPFENVHMTSQTRDSSRTVSGTRFARWRWQAPAGTGIVTVDGQRWQVLRDGFQHRIGGVDQSGNFQPFTQFAATDTTKRNFSSSFVPFARAIETRLLCAKAEEKHCDTTQNSTAGVRGLTITLDDSLKPAISMNGPLAGDGWLRGAHAATFSSADTGSGLRYAQTLIDGAVRAQTEHPCDKTFIAGQWRGTKMQPCGNTAGGSHTVQTSALSDGPHQLRQCAIDFAGNQTCVAERTIRTDNTAPAAPRDLRVEGGDQWRRDNGFRIEWDEPGQGQAAPVVVFGHRTTGPGADSAPTVQLGRKALGGIRVPGPGEFKVSVWLIDQAGNSDPSAAATATLRFDDVPPEAYFLEPPAEDPERIRLMVSDRHSGIAGGTISFRPETGGEWTRLPAEPGSEGDESFLEARFPVDALAPGTYEFRAGVTDNAGNATETTKRGNGSKMTLRINAKAVAELTAGLSHGHGGERAQSLLVPFAANATVSGRLSAPAGVSVADLPLVISQKGAPGSAPVPATIETRTDSDGAFSVGLDSGASRTLAVRFAGDKRLTDAAVGPLELKVKGAIGLRVTPKRLRTGQRLTFSGRVDRRSTLPAEQGNLVAIQYLERTTGTWRPVAVTRTGTDGRYARMYRFRFITRPTSIRLRAVLLPSQIFPYESVASAARTVLVKPRKAKKRGRHLKPHRRPGKKN